MTSWRDNTRDERGFAMMYVAIFLLSSLWLVSLAIDVGKLTVTKAELQRAADAAALAGASIVDPTTGNIVQDSARVLATYAASQNTALREGSEPVIIDPQTDVSFPTPHQVKVTVHREESTGNPMTTIFARTLGVMSSNIHTFAVAEVRPTDKPCEKLSPFGVVNSDSGYATNCGSSYDLKIGSGPTSGNFQLLDYPACNEGPCAGVTGMNEQLHCYIVEGYGCCVKIGDELTYTEPGDKVGIIKRAIEDRWDLDSDQTEGICYQDYLKAGKGNGERVITSALIETFDVNGKKGVNIVGFAAFFMLDEPGKGGPNNFAHGQFINYVVPGESDEDPPANSKLFTIRLVQ